MFRVRWEKSALDELATIWTDTPDLRHTITSTTHLIDQLLRANPLAEGESRSEGRRVLVAFPLGIQYRVEPDESTVSILRVWLIRKKGT